MAMTAWAGGDGFPGTSSLAEELDKKLLVYLRDGRKLIGILRSFDQFANVVLEGTYERIVVGDMYCDEPLGLYIVRGENVVLLGQIDPEKELLPPHIRNVSLHEIRQSPFLLASLSSNDHGPFSAQIRSILQEGHHDDDGMPFLVSSSCLLAQYMIRTNV
eukprot:jgi/Mesvir1/6856/Mv09027-RA.1